MFFVPSASAVKVIDIHISNEEIPLIVPSQPGTIPDSQYAHSSNLLFSDLVLGLPSQATSIDIMDSGNSLELVMSSITTFEDYQLYQSDVNLNGQPGVVIFQADWRRVFQVIWRRSWRGFSLWLADLRTEEPEVGSPPALGLVGAWLYPALGVSSPNDRALSSG